MAVSSAVSSEGKTTLACHVATSLARAGRRVVLVDCDLRRPSIDQVFSLDGDTGLCEVLRGEIDVADATVPTSVKGLSVLPAGVLDAVAQERLVGDSLRSAIGSLRDAFDFVVLDTSPVLPVCDALLVAQHADAVLFAVRRDVSRLSKVAAAVERFNSIDVPVMGAVAIGLDDDPVGYGSYYRHRDRYTSGSGTLVHSS